MSACLRDPLKQARNCSSSLGIPHFRPMTQRNVQRLSAFKQQDWKHRLSSKLIILLLNISELFYTAHK